VSFNFQAYGSLVSSLFSSKILSVFIKLLSSKGSEVQLTVIKDLDKTLQYLSQKLLEACILSFSVQIGGLK
jgi:hypothetical protein